MRSHRNENGHTLLVVPRDVIGPFRNALQKVAGGIDFFALDPAEREILEQALRHLWNPGDDAPAREKTVPIDVLAVSMRDHSDDRALEGAALGSGYRKAVPLARMSTVPCEDTRQTVELDRSEISFAAVGEQVQARSDGYRAPTKGRHRDVSR
jgi:hypothetical protein